MVPRPILTVLISDNDQHYLNIDLQFMQDNREVFFHMHTLILRKFCLDKNSMQLVQRMNFKAIVRIDFEKNNICDIGIKMLTTCNYVLLQELFVGQNKFGNPGLTHLAHAYWPNLKLLSVQGNKYSPEGLKTLAKGHWPSLEFFYGIPDILFIYKQGKIWLNSFTCHLVLDLNSRLKLDVQQVYFGGWRPISRFEELKGKSQMLMVPDQVWSYAGLLV